MQDIKNTFSFGKNWQDFVSSYLTPERVIISQQHLLDFLHVSDLKGKYFLDIGCGSGLSSLAAYKAGAAKIVSFDVDLESVKATERIRAMHNNPPHWIAQHGSILDSRFIQNIERADIVYSWGVLHHTGNMWQAIKNAAGLLRNTGCFYIALYTTTPKSAYWIQLKKKYNQRSEGGKRLMELWYIVRYSIIPLCIQRKNPARYLRDYKTKRGMAYLTNVRDWLGGYPYEDAKIEEVLNFARKQLNLELIDIKTGEANTEYLFIKTQ